MERDGEERLERVLDRARRRGHVATEDINERVNDLALGADDGTVGVDGGEEAVYGGGGGLYGGGRRGGGVMRDHVRDRVEDATSRHERLLLRDGQVEQRGRCVLLGSVRGRVEGFCYVRDCASFGDYGSGLRVLLGHEAKLAEGVDASGFGDGAELGD